VISENEEYITLLTEYRGEASLARFYTEESAEGRLDLVRLGEVENAAIESSNEITVRQSPGATTPSESVSIQGGVGNVDPQEALEQQSSIPGVERSTAIDRGLGDDCDYDYCDGFTYEHGQTGFSVDFHDTVSNIGSATLSHAIGTLADRYLSSRWGRRVGGLAGLLASVILSVGTGSKFTVSPYDYDVNGYIFNGPEVRFGVGRGWKERPSGLQRVAMNPGDHLGALDGRCG